jgi:type II secretory ATPase GspE/PulE/Tfp pilus assembly ATPase PilB-like protein
MEITDAVRDLILGRSSTVGLRRQAVREGMVSLRQSGLRKIAAGQTTVEEVTRETTP